MNFTTNIQTRGGGGGMQYAANIVKFYNPYHVHDSLIHDFNFMETYCTVEWGDVRLSVLFCSVLCCLSRT